MIKRGQKKRPMLIGEATLPEYAYALKRLRDHEQFPPSWEKRLARHERD